MKRLLPARLVAALGGEGSARLELPPDVLRESRRRVRFAAVLGTLAYTVFLALEMSGLMTASSLEHTIDLRHDVLAVMLCAALLIAAALPAVTDRAVLALALLVEFLLSVLISTHVPWAAFVRTGHVGGVTWVVPIIILFALLVPFRTHTTLAISTLCALTMPLGLWALSSRNRIAIGAGDYWTSAITAGVALAIATLASRTVYGAGRQLVVARMVGSYELIERIGQGGMGEVWKARHLLLARPAAVKLILADSLRGSQEARESALERFTREAKVTASLRSPHTVELFDFGVSSDGALYYAMEMLEGMNLEHFVYRFGPIEPRRAVHWLRQACHSLGEAHACGLVHRDVKPGNIHLCRYGRDADFIKVLDFGLTKPLTPSPDPGLTQPGMLLGTPGYMAPEQVFGLASTPSADLYALGCVGYWLLAGVKPFEADSVGEMLRQHVQSPPPPLAARAPRPIPARLEALVMGCLSKNPDERPRDADHLSDQLAESVDGDAWTVEMARQWWNENLSEV
ncbi:MAG: serine/threonine-protein kinase [Candidatus Eisenbacteria bacterium]